MQAGLSFRKDFPIPQFYIDRITTFLTTWASLFEMELEPNLLDCNGNELEHKLELEEMKRTIES